MTPDQIRSRVERLTEALVCRGAVAWLDGDGDRGWLRVMTYEGTIDCGVREEFDGTELYVILRHGMEQPQRWPVPRPTSTTWPPPCSAGSAGHRRTPTSWTTRFRPVSTALMLCSVARPHDFGGGWEL